MSSKPDSNNNNSKQHTILAQIDIKNRKSQDLMLKTLEQIMPEYYNFSQLAMIFEKNQTHPQPLYELNYQILKYFVKTISQNCINMKGYQLLEEQAQKLEATIRSHIKVEQEMKMYLDYLESKITAYEAQLNKSQQEDRDKAQYINQIQVLKSRQSILMKEKIVLLKRNEQLIRQIEKKNQQIKILQQKPKTDNFIMQKAPFYNPNQVSNISQISSIEVRRTESQVDGPYSYRKVQSQVPNQNNFMRQIRERQGFGIIPNRSYHHFNLENMGDFEKLKNVESHMIRKSNDWQEGQGKRKKTQEIASGNSNNNHYKSSNSEDERAQLYYRSSNTQGDRIIEQENQTGFKKVPYERINMNLKSSVKKTNLRIQETQKDKSIRQQYSSQKINPNQIGRRIEIKKIQPEQQQQAIRSSLKSQYQKYNQPQNQVSQNKTSQTMYQDSRNKQMSFTEGTKPQKTFQISIVGHTKSTSKHPIMVNHPDHQITQKKSSNPLPQTFYSQRGQTNQTSQHQMQSIVHPQYMRLQGNHKY